MNSFSGQIFIVGLPECLIAGGRMGRDVLDAMQAWYGEDRYRPAGLLRRIAAAGGELRNWLSTHGFHEASRGQLRRQVVPQVTQAGRG